MTYTIVQKPIEKQGLKPLKNTKHFTISKHHIFLCLNDQKILGFPYINITVPGTVLVLTAFKTLLQTRNEILTLLTLMSFNNFVHLRNTN